VYELSHFHDPAVLSRGLGKLTEELASKPGLRSVVETLYDRLIETEQDTRIQVIDRMLVDVLGWQRTDIKTEPSVNSGYVDYLVRSDNRNRFVVEAKRADRLLIDTMNPKFASYKVGGVALGTHPL
jgi:predicted type IV restriction endonuclease